MTPEMQLPALRVYSRQGCHLCEELIETLEPVVRDRLSLEIVDIDSRTEWQAAYGSRIPVVEYKGQFVCQYVLDRAAVGGILAQLPES